MGAGALRASATPSGVTDAVPGRGEHGAEILRAAGLSAAELGHLLPSD